MSDSNLPPVDLDAWERHLDAMQRCIDGGSKGSSQMFYFGVPNRPISFATVPKSPDVVLPRDDRWPHHTRHGIVGYYTRPPEDQVASFELVPYMQSLEVQVLAREQILASYPEESMAVIMDDAACSGCSVREEGMRFVRRILPENFYSDVSLDTIVAEVWKWYFDTYGVKG